MDESRIIYSLVPETVLSRDAARSCHVPTLHSLCCDVITECLLTLHNAPELLEFACSYRVEPLRQRVLAFVTTCWVGLRDLHTVATLREALGDELFVSLTEEQAATDRLVAGHTRVGEVVERPPVSADPPEPRCTADGRVTYPLQALRTGVAWPPGVGADGREEYLSDGDFETVFAMSRAAYTQLPAWKRANLRRQADLF